ncbi:MAG: HAMP domain-containing protein [Chloroflexi bacterium]|nr:HAMP domain-containing protein [Chloroflexota bacterium]
MKLNIQTKLLGAFGLMIALMIAVFGVGFWGMNTIANDTTEIVTVDLVEDIGVRELEVLILEQTATYEDFVITGNEEDLVAIEHETEAVHEHFTALEEEFHGDAEMLELLYVVEDEYVVFLEAGDALVALVQANASKEDIIHELELLEADERLLEEDLGLLTAAVEHNIQLAYEDALANKSLATKIAIGTLIVSALIAAGLALVISRGLAGGMGQMLRAAQGMAQGDLEQNIDVKSSDEVGQTAAAFGTMMDYLKGMAKSAELIAEGDLTVQITPISERDTLGNAFSKMIANLREIVGEVTTTARDVGAASEQLASAAEQAGQATQSIAEQAQSLSKGAEEQKKSVDSTTESVKQLGSAIEQIASGSQQQNEGVETTSTAITEVSRAITEVASNAQEAAEGAKTADEAARKGLGIVDQTVEGMGQIKDAVQDVADRISDLGEQSAEIGKIVSVIDDIAAQTNLLALNAAIEAARAGEQGRGFAVVADEVRQLAERVTQATSEIAILVDGVQKGVEESVKATERGTSEVERGSELANEAGAALNEIQEAVVVVTSQVEQISAAAEEVAASSDEMVKSIEGVSAITEQTTAATEEMAASNDEVQSAMNAIAAITEQTGAAVEESSASTEELSSQVEEVVASSSALGEMAVTLKDAVSRFKLDAEDGAGETVSGKPETKETEKLAA